MKAKYSSGFPLKVGTLRLGNENPCWIMELRHFSDSAVMILALLGACSRVVSGPIELR